MVMLEEAGEEQKVEKQLEVPPPGGKTPSLYRFKYTVMKSQSTIVSIYQFSQLVSLCFVEVGFNKCFYIWK